MKQEIDRQRLNETLSCSVPVPEAVAGSTKSGNCNTLKLVTAKPFGITKLGARIILVVENLDESDQFILGRDFIRNFDVTIDLSNAMFRIRNPDRRYAIKPVNLIIANENKAPVFLRPKYGDVLIF